MPRLHPDFRFNDIQFESPDALIAYAENDFPEAADFLRIWFSDGGEVQVKTSGSTGKPKVIPIKKQQMMASAKATGRFFELPAKTQALLCMSAEYIAGKMMWVRAMELGWHLDAVPPASNPLKGVSKTYDFSAMVPLQAAASIDELYKIKTLIIGGGSVSTELLNRLKNIPTRVFATYGMTETVTHIAVRLLNGPGATPGYKVLPGIKIFKDERSCLVIDAPRIASQKVITNDLVDLIAPDTFIWKGRFDNVINSGGVKLIPEEIEKKLEMLIKRRFFVAGLPDERLGERLILIVEGEPFELKPEEYFKTLDRFERPKAVYFLDRFVETGSGKVNRAATKQLLPQ